MKRRRSIVAFSVTTILLAFYAAVAWADNVHQKGTLFKGTMTDSSGKSCASAVFKLDTTEPPKRRAGMAKGCGLFGNFMEYSYPDGKEKMCDVSETSTGITFKCNYRGKKGFLIGSFSGQVCKDCADPFPN